MSDSTNDPSFYIDKKLQLIQSIGQVTMLWWVTAIVLCFSVIGAAWMHHDKIKFPSKVYLWLGGSAVLAVFILLAAYAYFVLKYLYKFETDITKLLSSVPNRKGIFDAEIGFFIKAMWTATADFIALIVIWIFTWWHIHKHHVKKMKKHSSS